ncbi:MAG TPA: murein biosynthesis integral membrane protein MurJ [Phycisphaerae bacterium]|nr:murein biosynthesis integral membrane protein MurJ [Phycisphaerae bacterium]HPP22807.1 murein biosynthesis integral membrane protein MurJ [Phycisphaerae bacterium]HPU34486.1 murein biosynthesis integral membrane protein MurJ [Phycisphaerae bacterium]HQE44535.1 murein biosynthesis integral membrane protein MurJ [Phycisphaerae bacterium]HXK87499.1 murein biosynthesis integral membrane protein MurJ [Phycisphaerae bacterium]
MAAGIFLSRITGLIRDRVFAHYFGNADAADAFKAAQKIPNFLQNLLGEGVLSASFIPVYARLLATGERASATGGQASATGGRASCPPSEAGSPGDQTARESATADRVASAIGSLLAVSVSFIVALGVLLTPYFVDLVAPGFTGDKRELTIRLVRILFPGVGLLVMSAWCLGILNSHRRFFLSYVSPVLSNAAMIAAMIAWGWGGRHDQNTLVQITAWSLVAGNLLQFAVQLPTVWRLVPQLRPVLDTSSSHIRTIIRNFGPVVLARGVVQVSAYIDNIIASFLPMGAVASLGYAQTLYLLPVSLFGMSVSAAELPAMSGASGSSEEIAAHLHKRLDAGLRQIAFFIIPSAAAFLAFGDVVVGAIYQTGQFTRHDTRYVWTVLAGFTLGLPAMTFGRLYASTFYALRDTRTPLNFALVHVAIATVLGYLFALRLPGLLGIDPRWGAAALTASAAFAGWIEFVLLRRSLNARIGHTGLSAPYAAQLCLAALAAVLAGSAGRLLHIQPPLLAALVTLVPFGLAYLIMTTLLRIPEAQAVLGRFMRKTPR